LLGERAWISRAWHSPAQIPGEALDADALVLSPVLAPRKGAEALGLEALAAARTTLDYAAMHARRRPLLYALGGIDAAGAARCIEAGVDGVAAIGATFEADPLPLLEALGIACR
jgi:thiamine monophosphate synthase